MKIGMHGVMMGDEHGKSLELIVLEFGFFRESHGSRDEWRIDRMTGPKRYNPLSMHS